MCNPDIREYVELNGLKFWQVAEAAGISHTTLCIWLRTKLTDDKRTRVINAVEKLLKERAENDAENENNRTSSEVCKIG